VSYPLDADKVSDDDVRNALEEVGSATSSTA
jgi:hypothetical protein